MATRHAQVVQLHILPARTDCVGAWTQQVIAFSREKAGVGGKKSKDDIERDFAGAYKVVFGDVTVRTSSQSCCCCTLTPPRRRAWSRCAKPHLLRRWTWSCRASLAAPEAFRRVRRSIRTRLADAELRSAAGLLGHRLPGHSELPGGWARAGREAFRFAQCHLRAEATPDVPEGQAQV